MSLFLTDLAGQAVDDSRIRKDFHAPAPVDNGHILQTLVSTVTALQRQVEDLSKRSAPASAPAPPPAPQALVPAQAAAPVLGMNIEDTFLATLSDGNPMVVLGLMNDFWGISEYILPLSPDKKPAVSQSVCLALLHKVSFRLLVSECQVTLLTIHSYRSVRWTSTRTIICCPEF